MAENAPAQRPVVGFVLTLVGGILILLVGGLLGLLSASLGGAISSLGGASLGAIFFIYTVFAFLCGAMVVVAAVLLYRGKRVAGGVLAIVFSILSLFAGGGLLVGMALGIVGGVLGLLEK